MLELLCSQSTPPTGHRFAYLFNNAALSLSFREQTFLFSCKLYCLSRYYETVTLILSMRRRGKVAFATTDQYSAEIIWLPG